MATTYHFDLYPRTDPRDGDRLVRFTTLQKAAMHDVVGVGGGVFELRSTEAEADFIDPLGEQYVRVVEETSSVEQVVAGFWTSRFKHSTAVRRDTKRLTVSGPAVMDYLARARMAPYTYADVPGFIPQDPIAGIWNLWSQSTIYAGGNYLGAMLWRVLHEATHVRVPGAVHRHADGEDYTDDHGVNDRTVNPLPDLVLGFDQFQDSDGNDWDLPSGEFKASVGENVLSVVQRLMQAGLYVEMNPDTFEVNAWQSDDHRRDRTGSAWGASVVRFQAPTAGDIDTGNIHSDTVRSTNSQLKFSKVWAGNGDTWVGSNVSLAVPWEHAVDWQAEDTDALGQVAAQQRASANEASDSIEVQAPLGNDPGNGFYRPWREILKEDLVTVDTGTDQWDFDDQAFPVSGLKIEQRSGGDWGLTVELGASFSALSQRTFTGNVGGAHTHPPDLCIPAVPAQGLQFLGLLGCESDHVTQGASLTFPDADLLTVPVNAAVPVGDAIVAVIARNNAPDQSEELFDEDGNTWVLDASYENTSSSSDNRIEFWHTNVTDALESGDEVTLGLDRTPGGGNGRAMALLHYSSALTFVNDSTGSNSESISDVPAGLLQLVGLSSWNKTSPIAGDADWDKIAECNNDGETGLNHIQLLVEHLIGASGVTTWSIADTVDNASLAVAYSAAVGGTGAVNDGHVDLVGTASPRKARCDHRHDVHRDTEPTADDDWATAGYKLGTIWAQVDDLGTPTEILGVWMLVDDSTGAAVWADWPGGGGGGGLSIQQDTIPLIHVVAGTTYNVNNTAYAAAAFLLSETDFDVVPWTHFAIYCWGNSNAAGQTITLQGIHGVLAGTLSAAGNDLVVTNTFGFFSTGWIAINPTLTGLQHVGVAAKGSNSTVDLTVQALGIMLKYDP